MGEGKSRDDDEDYHLDREGKVSSSREEKCSGDDLHERIQVVENENRRKGQISRYPKEVAQLVKDIFGYFDGVKGVHLSPPATRSDVNALSPCPDILSQMYESHDGGWYVYDYAILSASDANEKRGDTEDYVPFAENVDGELLVCGIDDHEGGVYSFDLDEGGVGENLGKNLASYLEEYCKDLLSGRLEYIEDCGMVEKD